LKERGQAEFILASKPMKGGADWVFIGKNHAKQARACRRSSLRGGQKLSAKRGDERRVMKILDGIFIRGECEKRERAEGRENQRVGVVFRSHLLSRDQDKEKKEETK